MAAYDVVPGTRKFRTVRDRVVRFASRAPDEVVEEGLGWYPAVNSAIRKQAPAIGIDLQQGAGIVAAVSPNMDFERNNINALDEIREIRPAHWADIAKSHEQAKRNKAWNAANRSDIKAGRVQQRYSGRHPDTRAMLREIAPNLSVAPDPQLLKAGRILSGEHPEEVLNRRTAPKTNSFYHNLVDPRGWDFVTIDGRQADIIADNMRIWADSSRGISSAALPSGKPSRYEMHEELMRAVTRRSHVVDSRLRGASPADLQAVTWVEGKRIERAVPTVSGEPRKVGVHREGQKYSELQRRYG